MASLYQLSAEFRELERQLLEGHEPGLEGADVEALTQAFAAVSQLREEKLAGCIAVHRNLKAEQEAVQNEIERLTKREDQLARSVKTLSNYVANCLKPGERYHCAIGSISWRHSEAVEGKFGDETEVPECYQRVVTKVTPDKVKMKQDLKIGATIPGWILSQRTNLVIK